MADRLRVLSAQEASTKRKAILRGIYDDNVRLRKGLTRGRAASQRRTRRLLVSLASSLTIIAGAQVLHAWGEPSAVLAFLAPHPQVVDGPTGVSPIPPIELPATTSSVSTADTLRLGTVASADTPALLPAGPELGSTSIARSGDGEAGELTADVRFDWRQGNANIRSLFGLSVKTIVIDAGHGGHDPGTVGEMGTLEKDITLDIARRLKEKLEQSGGYRILLVRDEDVFVPLSQRAAFANSRETDLFVSIHVNYLPRVSTNAIETYYFGRHEDARTRELAERENAGSQYSLSEFENVVRNIQDTVKLQESKALAHSIQSTLLNQLRSRNQKVLNAGVRAAPFVVLLGVKAPSVLVEIASLSSPQAEHDLRTADYRDQIASYLATGITEYHNMRPQEDRKNDQSKSKLAKQ